MLWHHPAGDANQEIVSMSQPAASRPRISCSTGSLYYLPLATALAVIRDAGYDGVELVANPETLARGLAATQRIITRSGLPALSYHPPLYPFPGWPRGQEESIMSVAQGARALGCEVAVVHAPKGYSLATPRAQCYVAGIGAGQAYAAQHRFVIGLETTQRPVAKPPMLFDDLDTFLEFADEHQLAVTLDTCHAAANGDDLLDLLPRLGSRLHNIHLSDCLRDASRPKPRTHRMPGAGNTVDLAAFLGALSQTGYAGLITLEIAPAYLGWWPPSRLAGRLAEARAYVAAALNTDQAEHQAATSTPHS
jgi:sugar phosphate isomerase/epimerase